MCGYKEVDFSIKQIGNNMNEFVNEKDKSENIFNDAREQFTLPNGDVYIRKDVYVKKKPDTKIKQEPVQQPVVVKTNSAVIDIKK
jgi:hypothetical protein